jgi:uncharacterized protein (DUF2147 family)
MKYQHLINSFLTRSFLNHVTRLIAILLLTTATTKLALANSTWTQDNSPIGIWKTIDDETGEAKSLVEISIVDGVLTGKINQLFNPTTPNPVCDKCKDEKKDQPIIGMTIIEGVTFKEGKWTGGTILDPKTGKTYRVTLTLESDKQSLKVRGYIGSPILGRTQIWQRG